MVAAFLEYFKTKNLLQPQINFIAACSGGIDSVVLCELCHQANLSFSIAHCNFGLRGAESDRDEAFVQGLAERYGVPFFIEKFDTKAYGHLKKLSIQEAARELRYHWFEELRKARGAAHVLLAHHANDNIETVLMNLARGTGLHGLTGMPEQSDKARCLRPLLKHTRSDIEAFARTNGLQWVDDSSNRDTKYTRNFFRAEIIPAVKTKYPQVEENILDTIARLKKTEALYQTLLNGLLKKLVKEEKGESKVPIAALLKWAHTSLPYELFKKFGFGEKQLAQILGLAQSQSGSFVQGETHRVIRHGKWFIITAGIEAQAQSIVVEEGQKKVALPGAELRIKWLEKEHSLQNPSTQVAQLDAGAIHFPLLLRRWKTGDYFYPLGMRKKKKLARFFIDQKLSTPQKEAIWVLESRARIIWVVGHRIDDRFKITDGTKRVLQLTLQS